MFACCLPPPKKPARSMSAIVTREQSGPGVTAHAGGAARPPAAAPPAEPPVTAEDVAVQVPPLPEPDDETLYVVLSYFNFCAYKQRKKLFYEFVERIKDEPGIKIVVSEAVLTTEPEEHQREQALLPMTGIWKHLRYTTKHAIWLKENLCQMAIHQLPSNWKYVAWIDADIVFLNKTWVSDTVDALRTKYDVVQLFFKCENLDERGQVGKVDKSFGYMHVESGRPYVRSHVYGFWHPGYAWAMTRAAHDQMRGLVEFGILGSGDNHMSLALIGKVDYSHPGNIHPVYRQKLADYQERVRGLRLGYVPGIIQHMYHGPIANRHYQQRWLILTQGERPYDPSEHVAKNECGLLQLTRDGMHLERPIRIYFAARREDDGTFAAAAEQPIDLKKLIL